MESEILGFRILNLAQEIRNLANDWNPESGIQYLESGIHSVESRIQDLNYLTWKPERKWKE